MQKQTIKANNLITLDWFGNKPVDWNSAGTVYTFDGKTEQLQQFHFGTPFDTSITSACGHYVLLYEKLGTKGLLLKDGEIAREINRSYYHADAYEFPAVFFNWNSRTYLAHCPAEYCRLEFEDVETGEILTNILTREPRDIFHSRLEVSPDNKFLLSKGWFWHPFDTINLFDIEACIHNPCLLDNGNSVSNVTAELCSASFIDNDRILIYASNEEPMNDEEVEPILPQCLAIWDFKKDQVIHSVKMDTPMGNVFAIDENTCWDLFEYPKIIDLLTGKVLAKAEEIKSGKQSSSIIHHIKDLPKVAYNRKTKQMAIATGNVIEVLTP